MRVRVRFFAGTRDAVGRSAVEMDVPEGAALDEVVERLCHEHPRLAPYRPHMLLALDGAFVTPASRAREGSEIAIMPPVSGGSGALQEDAFSLDAIHAEIERAGAEAVATPQVGADPASRPAERQRSFGAVVVFVGHVRGDGGTERLRFEAYAPMAERAIGEIRAEAIRKFALAGCIVRHRIATLAVGEPIVAVATAAAHRREAFEAAMWIMDELKTRVPIWKAEESSTGSRYVNDPTTKVE